MKPKRKCVIRRQALHRKHLLPGKCLYRSALPQSNRGQRRHRQSQLKERTVYFFQSHGCKIKVEARHGAQIGYDNVQFLLQFTTQCGGRIFSSLYPATKQSPMAGEENPPLVVTQLQQITPVVQNNDRGGRISWSQPGTICDMGIFDRQSSDSRMSSTLNPWARKSSSCVP